MRPPLTMPVRALFTLATLANLCLANGVAQAGPDCQRDLACADARWNEARQQGDAAALAPLLAADWLLTHSDGRVQDKADYVGELATRSRRNGDIVNRDVQVRRYGDTAVVTGMSIQSGVSNGVPWSGRFRFTRVWIQRDGLWTMVASHSSRLPE